MAKAKAPEWLRLAFRDGVDERLAEEKPVNRTTRGAYPGANPLCWLAQFDPLQRPCAGPLERMHGVKRERIENAFAALLPYNPVRIDDPNSIFEPRMEGKRDLVLLAAWDPRIARIGCGHEHHPRFDSKQMPTLIVPRSAVPDHMEEWAADWGLDFLLDERFPDTVPPSQR